ncbi:hypothetical protein C0991_003035 [Blastosporella zonata]|nr:hypothetical protein C0991_003035 [Blastosporella zonata]
MPVHEDSSIAPDSTLSTSPPTTPVVIKRATRVYGRRTTEPVGLDSDISLLHSAKSSSSNGSIHRTGLKYSDEEVPPSSDAPFDDSIGSLVDDDAAEDGSHDAPHAYAFAWKAELERLDKEEDSDMDMADPVAGKSVSGKRSKSGHSLALSPQICSPSVPLLPTSPAEPGGNASTRTFLGGSMGTSTAPSSPSAHGSFVRSPSPSTPQPAPSRVRRRKAVVHDSDSEEEEGSPSNTYAIATPKEYSSPTPPTSVDGMHALSKHDTKGKGKAKDFARPDVAPLSLSEDPTSNTFKVQKRPKDRGSQRQKVKAPTKQERKETVRESARMTAERLVAIPRPNVGDKSLDNFWKMVSGSKAQQPESEADPIVDFSSDHHTSPAIPHPTLLQGNASSLPRPPKHGVKSPSKVTRSLLASDDDSDVDLPEVSTLLVERQKTHESEKRRQELLDKKRALAATTRPDSEDDDDDDDLLVVSTPDMQIAIKEEEAERRSGRKKHMSEGRKRQLNLGGIGLKGQKAKVNPPKINDLDLLRRTGTHQSKKGDPQITQEALNRMILSRVKAEGLEVVRAKEEEWTQRGGKLKVQEESATSSVQEASKLYAEKVRNLPEGSATRMDVEDEGDASDDEDWSPELGTQLRGSASPSPGRESGDEDEDDEEEGDLTMVNDGAEVEEEDANERLPLKPRRSAPKAIVDSDDEDVVPTRTNIAPRNLFSVQDVNDLPTLTHRNSMSSLEEATEDEGDKENETSRMWDRGEDKENTAVVRHLSLVEKDPLATRNDSLFGPESGLARQLSMSPGFQFGPSEDGDDRPPLKKMVDDDPFASPSRTSKTLTSFQTRLKLASPVASQPSATPPLSLAPFIGAEPLGFSQFLDDEPSAVVGPLQASFSALFESGTEKHVAALPLKRPLGGLEGSFTNEGSPRNKLARTDTLDLTQDVTLQPAFEVSGTFLRKADQIFEKEQEYIVEAANKKTPKEQELYVNEHGFLTQTRPDVPSPEVYRHPSPTQAKGFSGSGSQSTSRRPLRTISLADESEFNSPAPLGRLHKRATTPTSPLLGVSYKSSLSPSPSAKRPANAFDVLKRASKYADKPKRNHLDKSEFIEAEAQESDDDEMFGFGLVGKGKDDEEDGEDLDKVLETLVDDADMDEDTVAAELVKEKFMEHEKQDDETLQKLHEAAAQGDLRKKRRNRGLGLEDSDDESDEDDRNRRIRRDMKKQKIERDNIKELGEHEETKSFYDVYEQNLAPDDTDFAYLQESQPADVIMADVDEMVDEDGKPRERITVTELLRRTREIARKPCIEEEEVLDPTDVSWVDGDQSDEEGGVRVRPLPSKPGKQLTEHRRQDQTEFDETLSMPPPKAVFPEHSISRMHTWAKTEGRSRHNGTTGRNVGGAAVTGHKAKFGGGSLRKGAPSVATASGESSEPRRPAKEPSFLAKVAADSRTKRFG